MIGEYDDEAPPALGTVLEQGRGALPFALIHGEALVACAAWALGESGVTLIDVGTEWAGVVASGEPFVLHDPMCPMTPGWFIGACLARALETDRIVVAVRPVTDTVKVIRDGQVVETLDRDALHAVASPIVLPARVVAGLPELPDVDFPALVSALAANDEIELMVAPASARRVGDLEDLRVLEALTEPR